MTLKSGSEVTQGHVLCRSYVMYYAPALNAHSVYPRATKFGTVIHLKRGICFTVEHGLYTSEYFPNFWDPHIREHGLTYTSNQILQGDHVRGNFLQDPMIHHAPRHSERA